MTGQTVGIVGLGIMGSAWYTNLLTAGFEVVGYDIVADRRAELAAAGGRAVGSPAAVAGEASIVVTSLDRPDALADVVAGDGGLIRTTGRDLVVAETSTLPLTAKESARAQLAEANIRMLDCTVSGTGHQARERDIVLYASGDPDVLARCQEVFDAVARTTYDVGEFGNGSRMKFVANHLVAVHNLATAEALLLARRSGLDPTRVLEVIGDGAGSSRMWQIRGPVMVARTYDEPAARLEMFMKDIAIIGRHATTVGAPTPLFSAALPFYTAAIAQGRAQQDTAALIAVLEALTSDRTERDSTGWCGDGAAP